MGNSRKISEYFTSKSLLESGTEISRYFTSDNISCYSMHDENLVLGSTSGEIIFLQI